VWQEVLEAASSIEWPRSRVQVLAALSRQLPEPDRETVVQEALSLARAISDEPPIRLLALGDLAGRLEGPLREEAISEIQALTLDPWTPRSWHRFSPKPK
jgi:hypothetical protein